MIQIHDDLRAALAVPANPDWQPGRSSLPILFAQSVDHPERDRFLQLRRAAPDPQALAAAQAILIRCGAIGYGVHQLWVRSQEARQLLSETAWPDRVKLDGLLDDMTRPVKELFEAIGVSLPAAMP